MDPSNMKIVRPRGPIYLWTMSIDGNIRQADSDITIKMLFKLIVLDFLKVYYFAR